MIDAAIAADTPIVKIGDPIFYEHLGRVRQERAAACGAAREVDRIVGEMHADGTLTAFSEEWYEG